MKTQRNVFVNLLKALMKETVARANIAKTMEAPYICLVAEISYEIMPQSLILVEVALLCKGRYS